MYLFGEFQNSYSNLHKNDYELCLKFNKVIRKFLMNLDYFESSNIVIFDEIPSCGKI